MSEQNDGPTGPPPAAPPGTTPPGSPPPRPVPPRTSGGSWPTQPMPQWYPAVPRQPFRDRTTKLWVALVTALVCLLVGFGIGLAVGHATADDDRGPGRFQRFPDDGPGFGRDGQRFGFRDAPGRTDLPGLPGPGAGG